MAPQTPTAAAQLEMCPKYSQHESRHIHVLQRSQFGKFISDLTKDGGLAKEASSLSAI